MTEGLNPLFAQISLLCKSTYRELITHNLQCRAPTLPDSENAHYFSSIKLWVSPVYSLQEVWKCQQSSCFWISFKSCLGKLMFYTLQLGVLVYTISIS